MAEGWIKLHRRFLSSSTWENSKLSRFWIWCLLKASHSSVKTRRGYIEVDLSPGQFIFGRLKAADETGLTPDEIRTCVKTLKAECAISVASHSTKQFSILTIRNWTSYQGGENENPQPFAREAPTCPQRVPTYKNDQELQETTHTSAGESFETSFSPTYSMVVETYRRVSGRKSVAPNDRAGARILTEAIDAGDLEASDLEAVIANGLRDKSVPNQTLRGVANNFTKYLPAARAGPSREMEYQAVHWRCRDCGRTRSETWRKEAGYPTLRRKCDGDDGCGGIMDPVEPCEMEGASNGNEFEN